MLDGELIDEKGHSFPGRWCEGCKMTHGPAYECKHHSLGARIKVWCMKAVIATNMKERGS